MSASTPIRPAPPYLGLDLGSSRTKVALIDGAHRLRGHAVRKSGGRLRADRARLPRRCAADGATRDDVAAAVATGYGRNDVAFVTEATRTEIGCLRARRLPAFRAPSP